MEENHGTVLELNITLDSVLPTLNIDRFTVRVGK